MNADANPRILIVRLSAIGDVVHGLPTLEALRDALPRAYLAWVIEEKSADVVRAQRALDELIVLKHHWYKSVGGILDACRRVRAGHFDTSIDLQGLTKSSGLARASGAKRRIGLDGKAGRELSRWLNNVLVAPARTHVIDRNLELLAPLGIDSPRARLELEVSPTEAQAAARLLESCSLSGRFAVLNPGAGWRSKLWPPDRYAAVARHLGTRHGARSLVVWAAEREQAWAKEIVARSAGFATLAPPTTLRELAAITQRAAVVVGSDTGPLHIAAAVGAACVGLFGPMPAERNGPYGPRHIAIEKMSSTHLSHRRRRADPESMLAIGVEDVTAACDEILARNTAVRQSA